ncbi:MAG TPA: hypothetical protein VGF82_11645 [Terracidiphilus sp.]|jgi:hypothetical protein
MTSDRRSILNLIATGRITPAEAERLLTAWNESHETLWIVALGLAFALLAQVHLRELMPMLLHFFYTQLPAPAEALRNAISPITEGMRGLL